MGKIVLNFRDLNAPYKCIEKANEIFKKYAELTEAERYFSKEEIKESKEAFISDILEGFKNHYIDFLKSQIEEIKPAGLHGVYDFGLIAEYENIIKEIERF